MISKDAFIKITDTVIKELEGGYFHRSMLSDGRVSDPNGYFSAGPGRVDSGETMYGLDRVNGKDPAKISPLDWREFWSIIDKAGAANKWKYNYAGPAELQPKLRSLAASIMYPLYVRYTNLFFTPAAAKIINSDARLVFMFSYATWNGSGFFQKYAAIINEAVRRGNTGKDSLLKTLVDLRVNSTNELIRKTGVKIANLVKTMKPETGIGIVIVGLLALFF